MFGKPFPFLFLLLTVNTSSCIPIDSGCEEKWNIVYFHDTRFIKEVYFIDMLEENEDENINCLYKQFTERNIKIVTLKDDHNVQNTRKDDINDMNKTMKVLYETRSFDILFIVVMPKPNIELLFQSRHFQLHRRHPKEIIEFVLYKTTSSDEQEISNFLEEALYRMKFINAIVITLIPTVRYFKYDVDVINADDDQFGISQSDTCYNLIDIIRDNLKLRYNYPVRIAMFNRPPTSLMHIRDASKDTLIGSNGIGGKDGLMIDDIVKYMKFKAEYIVPEGIEPFGFVDENGTVTGVLKIVMDETADISSNSRFITSYGINDFYFLGYNHFDSLCAIVRRNEVIPLWVQIANTYSPFIWFLLFTQTAIIIVVRYIHQKIVVKRKIPLIELSIEIMFSYIGPMKKLQKSSQRTLLFIILLTSIIFVSIIQGNIRSAFTKRSHYPDINTLEELNEQFTKIYSPKMDPKLVFDKGHSDVFDELNKKIDSTPHDLVDLLKNIINEDIAVIMPLADFESYLSVNFSTISDKFHVVPECPRKYMYAYICTLNFPWKDDMEAATLNLIATGLPSWYFETTVREMKKNVSSDSELLNMESDWDSATMDMESIVVPLSLFAFGVMISVMVFIAEVIQ